jgi:hypothetical protein
MKSDRLPLGNPQKEIPAVQKSMIAIACALTAMALLGCSSTYTIRTTDGREYHSVGKPDMTEDRYIKFETKDGREVLLKQKEVSSISED